MSGGSYNYIYSKIEEVDRFESALTSMANRVERWADNGFQLYDDEEKTWREATDLERAFVRLRAGQLRAAGIKVKAAIDALQAVEVLMHDVEWAASGDYSPQDLLTDEHKAVLSYMKSARK